MNVALILSIIAFIIAVCNFYFTVMRNINTMKRIKRNRKIRKELSNVESRTSDDSTGGSKLV